MIEKPTYFLVNVKQRSSDWFFVRKKRITGSQLGKVLDMAPYYTGTKEELGEILAGVKKETFTKEAIVRMDKGTRYEDFIARYLEKELNIKIKEEGFCIWKQDSILGCSNDGYVDNDIFIEIKCPAIMYKPIVEYMENPDRDPESISHIWKSQLMQIYLNGVVTNRKYCIFCVYAHQEKKIFYQKIKIDYEYFYSFMYPTAKEFYIKYMLPHIEKKK
jgi:putative phage-type endonuclease